MGLPDLIPLLAKLARDATAIALILRYGIVNTHTRA
jgi:hypothetical protein